MSVVRHALTLFALAAVAPASSAAIEPCDREGLPPGSRCGSISVPASYDDPAAGSVDLDVVVLPALASGRAAADPIVFLAGGPGIAATGSALFFARNLTKMRQSRDLVLVDVRGTGRSAPDCRLSAAEKRDLVLSLRLPDSFERCAPDRRLRATLRTTVVARDLDQVRQALGAERINLLAASYGTRVALAYAHLYPERVRTCVLRGATPPGDVIPRQILEGARAEFGGLERARPGLTTKYLALVDALDAKPATVALGDENEVNVDGATFEGIARFMLYDPGTARSLPGLIDATAAGALDPLARVLAGVETIVAGFSIPVLLGVLCAEDVPYWTETRGDGPFASAALRRSALETCRAWSVPAARSSRKSVSTSVPTLLLSGANDPAAPAHVAARIQEQLPNTLHLITPGIGHFPTWTGCHSGIIAQFFESGRLEGLDVACAAEPPGRH